MPLRTRTNLDEFDVLAENVDNFPRPQSRDELEEYLSQSVISIDGLALCWWLDFQQRQRWPRLSQLAINLLAIPAMSAEPERVFSGGRRTISWERMQLGDDTIEIIECFKHWKRSGFVEGDLTTHEGGDESGNEEVAQFVDD